MISTVNVILAVIQKTYIHNVHCCGNINRIHGDRCLKTYSSPSGRKKRERSILETVEKLMRKETYRVD